MSFLIQKSPDQCLFAAPRSLSQLITSFIGSQCQGIRPAPLFAWPFKRSLGTFGILLILSCQRRLLLPFLLKLQYFLKRTYYNLCFAVIIQFSRYVLVMSFKARSPETLIFITWWAKMDSNHRPHDYQSCALASWAIGPYSLTSSWWRLAGSNRWPPACKAGALPAELNPHIFTILT